MPLPVTLTGLSPQIIISCCFNSHPRIDSVLQKPRSVKGLWMTLKGGHHHSASALEKVRVG